MAEVIVAYSDCIDIKIAHSGTKLIEYSNENDYAGISYDPLQPHFFFRVFAKFFKEREPEENESMELSDDSVEKLSGSTKTQKQIQVEPAPFYVHRKLKLILQHNFIKLDDVRYHKEENYEIKEINERFPFVYGESWLTQKEESYFVNVFGTVN